MKRPVLLLALALGVTLVPETASAQQSLVLSAKQQGTAVMLATATDPGTGNTLAVWIQIDPDDNDSRAVWVALLRRGKDGKYGARKARLVAPGEGKEGAINNRNPEVVWAPGMKNFFVVWEAVQPDGTRQIEGRIVKAKSGKPKGAVRVLSTGPALNTSPEVEARLLGGSHAGLVAWVRQSIPSSNRVQFEVVTRGFKRNGKPDGPPETVLVLDRLFTFLAGVYLIEPEGTGRNAADEPGILVIDGPADSVNTSDDLCTIRLVVNGETLDEKVIICTGLRRESNQVVHLYRDAGDFGDEDGVNVAVFSIRDGKIASRAELIPGPGSTADLFLVGFQIIGLLGEEERDADARAGDEFLVTLAGDGRVHASELGANNPSLTEMFRYFGATRGMIGEYFGRQAITVWIGRRNSNDNEEVRATIFEVPQN